MPCTFQDSWLTRDVYKDWILKTGEKTMVKCRFCQKAFSIGAMGESALKSHMKGSKHASLAKKHDDTVSQHDASFFVAAASSGSKDREDVNVKAQKVQQELSVVKEDVLKAEILWILRTIEAHHSYRSNEGVSDLFRIMFPDSGIAKQFGCSQSKTAYITQFGLAPYMKEVLNAKVMPHNFVAMFDESLKRKKTKTKDMDITKNE